MEHLHQGLTSDQVERSRQQHGSNAITPQAQETFLDKLLKNFRDPTVVILMVALAIITVMAFFGHAEWYEGVAIAAAVLIATGVATLSEHKNENAFQKLLEEASKIEVKVFRNGSSAMVGIDELVVGDLILLQPGDKIPADAILIQGHLDADQSPLTGEADAVRKVVGSADSTADDLHSEHHLFRGSVVVDGEAIARVTAVGDRSFYGRMIGEMQSEDRDSPLKVKLAALADAIGKFGTIAAVFIALAFMAQKLFMERDLTLATVLPYVLDPANFALLFSDFVTAITLAIVIVVVAVPEGLPMMIAIVLSLNMRKLLSDNVLVRKLLGIEAAGSMNILFSDKTGTLTVGKLQVSTVLDGDCRQHASYDTLPPALKKLVGLSITENTAAVVDVQLDGKLNIVGADRTEFALLQFAGAAFLEPSGAHQIDSVPFNSERKFSAVQLGGQHSITLVKGAPELVLEACTHYYDQDGNRQPLAADALEREMSVLASRSMRLLALATTDDALDGSNTLPGRMTLVAVIGLRDELRPDSQLAVRTAQQAGIQVVMVTGDRRETAEAIARDAGLLDIPDAVILTSSELEAMSDDQLRAVMPRLRVVARAYPHQKSRLVKVAQEMGMVGGMTGDGVNDAAALKRADVGFAMGSGTEVAKEAGDIIVLDDNFSSITRAALYGRTLFKSIRKFLVFQLTVNISAILVAFLGPIVGFDLPLTMIQLLWINLIMDTLAALAFSGEAALQRYMRERPIERKAALISSDMWGSILCNAVAVAMLSMVFLTYEPLRGLFSSEAAFLTAFFAFFVFIHNFNKFNARTSSLNLLENILDNKGFLPIVGMIFVIQIIFTYLGGDVLRTVGLTAQEWLYVLAFSLVIIPIDLVRKLVRNKTSGDPEAAALHVKPAPHPAAATAAHQTPKT